MQQVAQIILPVLHSFRTSPQVVLTYISDQFHSLVARWLWNLLNQIWFFFINKLPDKHQETQLRTVQLCYKDMANLKETLPCRGGSKIKLDNCTTVSYYFELLHDSRNNSTISGSHRQDYLIGKCGSPQRYRVVQKWPKCQ